MPYFDFNATAPLAATAREAWLHAQEESWQNPSSLYRAAARVKLRLEAARERLGTLLGVAPARLVFNSGATEGANAVMATWARSLPPAQTVAINPTEHPCVLAAARHFLGERVVELEHAQGVVRLDRLEEALASGRVGAVSVMAANNETGVLQPWREIARLCRRFGVSYHCDAAQWFGKLAASGFGAVDWVTASAHKFGGPKGTGFLIIPEGQPDFCFLQGGGQEHGHRAGTEDYPGIAALVAALVEAESTQVLWEEVRLRWRQAFETALMAALPGAEIVGRSQERLWNTVSIRLPHSENTRWVARLDKRGVQISTGSACAVGKDGPSPVMAALGYPPDVARWVIRASAGWETQEADWKTLLDALLSVEAELAREVSRVVTP